MPRFRLIHALLIYAVGAAILFPHVKWYVDNPDSFQYLHLAERYADGTFRNVINGYWSPLIIWLLILPVKLLGNGIIAFKVTQLIIGAITLLAWDRLLGKARIQEGRGLLLFAAIPFLLARSLLVLTGDLVFITIALFILSVAIDRDPFSGRRRAILFGSLGALLYFAKAFGFPLFIAFLAAIALFEIYRDRSKAHLISINAAVAFIAFALIASPWMIAMSLKYDRFTISEAARYNLTVEVAPMPEEFVFLPVLTDGLYEPPPDALSPWEAPGDLVDLTPLRPWTDPQRYAKLIERNLLSIHHYDFRRQLGALFLIALTIAVLRRGPWPLLSDHTIVFPVLLFLLLNLGYALILVNTRYIWLNTFLFLLLIAKLLPNVMPRHRPWRLVMLTGVVLLAIKRPVKNILYTNDEDVAAKELIADLLSPIATLRKTYAPDHALMRSIEELRKIPITGPIASLQSTDPLRGSYSSTLQIAHALGIEYHGVVPMEPSREEQLQQLQSHRIRHFVIWDGMPWNEGELIYRSDPPGPRIYDLSR